MDLFIFPLLALISPTAPTAYHWLILVNVCQTILLFILVHVHHVPNLTVKQEWKAEFMHLSLFVISLVMFMIHLLKYEDKTLSGSSGTNSRLDAGALRKSVRSFTFVLCLVMWYDILFEVNFTKKHLQQFRGKNLTSKMR